MKKNDRSPVNKSGSQNQSRLIQRGIVYQGFLPPQVLGKLSKKNIDTMVNGHFKHIEKVDTNMSKQLDNEKLTIGNERLSIIFSTILLLAIGVFIYFTINQLNNFIIVIVSLFILFIFMNSLSMKRILNYLVMYFKKKK